MANLSEESALSANASTKSGWTSAKRVLTACEFCQPDRIPRFDNFWEFPRSWQRRLGPEESLSDIAIWVPDETPFPSRARSLEEQDGWLYEIDGWGRTIRRKRDAYFSEILEVAFASTKQIEDAEFDPPGEQSRYLQGCSTEEAIQRKLKQAKQNFCVFGKTGGPYLRSSFMRGSEQFLMDIAGDPLLAKTIADRVADHLIEIGIEELHRWELQHTGIWIYDDMACNDGPMFSPKAFEMVFLPAYQRMITAFKSAGAKYVFLHSDGDIRPILEMMVDAGIDGLNPIERRANMNIVQLKKQYPELILTGGMCNTITLVQGPLAKIEAEAREIIDLGRTGGVVIGTHSISPEIPLNHYIAYHQTCLTFGNFGII
ncbi:hypothetical protein JXJ21_22890 [candidate division KSB1 bacterium]|nr:hypothetical protein [candidate division KSB1 bacterium]